jgi:tight adherence protein B
MVPNVFVVPPRAPGGAPSHTPAAAGPAAGHASIGPGTVATGAALNPTVVAAPRSLPLIGGPAGKWVVTGLMVLAVVLVTLAVLRFCFREKSDLDAALRPYSDQPQVEEEEESGGGVSSLVDFSFVRKAVDTTAKLAQNKGVLELVEQRLEQADLPLRAAEALFFWSAAVLVVATIALFFLGPLAAFAALVIFGAGPIAVLNRMAMKRKSKFMEQLPDALQLLSGSLRSGYSLLQGVEAVSQEAPEPMSTELRRVMVEARLGRPLEDSLQEAADRMASADFDWAVMAVRIQREVGGNLAELLDTVGETMVQRERLRRDVKALTAEGRMSAIVLAMLPPGIGVMMYVLNPKYVGTLFQAGIGKMLLVAATALAIGGFIWMKKMIEIDV